MGTHVLEPSHGVANIKLTLEINVIFCKCSLLLGMFTHLTEYFLKCAIICSPMLHFFNKTIYIDAQACCSFVPHNWNKKLEMYIKKYFQIAFEQ